MQGMGISVSVKVPKEIKAAAKEMPGMNVNMERLTAVLDAGNVTVQTVAVLAVFGAIVAVLLLKR